MSIENHSPPIEYRPVIGFPLYRVGNDGSIWSRIGGSGVGTYVSEDWHRLNGTINKWGYHCVILFKHLGSKAYARQVHRLMLEAFVGPCPSGMQCCHKDDDSLNNTLDNLRWGTPLENAQDKERNGRHLRGSRSSSSKLTEADIPKIRLLAYQGRRPAEIAREFGIAKSTVSGIVTRRRWNHVP